MKKMSDERKERGEIRREKKKKKNKVDRFIFIGINEP